MRHAVLCVYSLKSIELHVHDIHSHKPCGLAVPRKCVQLIQFQFDSALLELRQNTNSDIFDVTLVRIIRHCQKDVYFLTLWNVIIVISGRKVFGYNTDDFTLSSSKKLTRKFN